MRRIHLVVGLVGIVLFITSGLYMHYGYDHLRGMSDGRRLLFRSGHIYLLFSALLNAILGLYLHYAAAGWRRLFQFIASTLFLAATALCVVGFLSEPWLSDLDRPYTRLAIYGSGAAVVLSLLAAWPQHSQRARHEPQLPT